MAGFGDFHAYKRNKGFYCCAYDLLQIFSYQCLLPSFDGTVGFSYSSPWLRI